MPAYDYQCRACQERFSKHETIAEHSRGAQVAKPDARLDQGVAHARDHGASLTGMDASGAEGAQRLT